MSKTIRTLARLATLGCLLAAATAAGMPAPATAPAAPAAPDGALLLAGAPPGAADQGGGCPGAGRAGWLLARAGLDEIGSGRQGEIGATGGGGAAAGGPRLGPALPILMSLVVPGAGEIYLGHPSGLPLVALDAFSWIRMKKHDDAGNEVRDAYFVYAENHWSEDQLDAAFDPLNDEYPYVAGAGRDYFPDVQNKEDLPLWVSREDDEREYFENLGKWDQFVFGWDDFTRPEDLPGYTPTGTLQDLRQPGVSLHREIYRGMRILSNDHFEARDRYVYLNIATRIVSAFHVAWLQGLLGGGPHRSPEVAGHAVNLIARPSGLTGSRLGVALSY